MFKKRPNRRTGPPLANDGVSVGRGMILVRDGRLFCDLRSDECGEFCRRVLSCDRVQFVEVDTRSRTATIRVDRAGLADGVLEQLARRLQADNKTAEPSSVPALPQDRPSEGRFMIRRREDQGIDHHELCSRFDPDVLTAGTESDRAAEPDAVPVASGLRRVGYLSMAGASFGMAIIGVLVPGIPTVPFLLVTSYYLVRSSPSSNARLLRSKTFGPMIRDWHQHRGMRTSTKMFSIGTMIVVVGLTVIFGGLSLPLLVIVLLLMGLGMTMILSIRTIPHDPRKSREQAVPAAGLVLLPLN